jgi:hypothetical protein
VTSEAKLAWALADADSDCFTAQDHRGICTALGASETYSAVEGMLETAVRKRYPLPADLISALAAWLDCYIGNGYEPTTRDLLNRVEPQALPMAASPPKGQVMESVIPVGAPDHRGTRHVAPQGAP